MSKEDILDIVSQLSEEKEPVIRIWPRNGKGSRDARLMRVTGTNGRSFIGVLVDADKEDSVFLPYDTILHGTINVEQVTS